MAVRPPGSDGDAEAIEFGIAAFEDRLDDVSFPTTADRLVATLEDPAIPVDADGHTVALSSALNAVRRDRFETRQQLLEALHPVLERKREEVGHGIVGRLRSLLPV